MMRQFTANDDELNLINVNNDLPSQWNGFFIVVAYFFFVLFKMMSDKEEHEASEGK